MTDHVVRAFVAIQARLDGLDARLSAAERKLDQLVLKTGWLEEHVAASATTDPTDTLIDALEQRLMRIERHFGRPSHDR